jgi:hypothetical protein
VAPSISRVGGSGFTTMMYQGLRMAMLQVINDTQPTPVAAAQAVQPIDESVPIEIVTAQAVGVGTMRGTFYETWNQPVWQTLPGLQGTWTLLDILKRQTSLGSVTMQKVIKSPTGLMRALVYHATQITDVDAGENITIASMTLPKTITWQYCYSSNV